MNGQQEKYLERIIREHGFLLRTFNMEESIKGYFEEWLKNPFNSNIDSDNDPFLWDILEAIEQGLEKHKDDRPAYVPLARELYLTIGVVKKRTDKEKGNEYWKKHHQLVLEQHKLETTIKCNVVIISACGKPDTIISLIRAIKEDRLPYQRCSRPYGCACTYAFEPVRDKKGNLIHLD